jgi:hypothetical protein
MKAESLREKLATDPVERAKFIANTLEYMRATGMTITEEVEKELSSEAVKKAAEAGKAIASTVAIITIG